MRTTRWLMLACALCTASTSRADVIQDVAAAPDDVPAGGKATISFRLSHPAAVKVEIVDSDLRVIRTYDLPALGVGPQRVEWDCRDSFGAPAAPEAYTWRIEAKSSIGTDTWEPADLYSRPLEVIGDYDFDPETRVLSYRAPVPMRVWVRIGVMMGPCLRTLVEGEPRPGGIIAESWDGRDETAQISVLDQRGWYAAIFGYRLPRPCILVSGAGTLPAARFENAFLSRLTSQVRAEDPAWSRRRVFALADRVRPQLRVEQLSPDTFAASLVGQSTHAMANRVRLKWYIDGHCAGEDVDAVMPSLFTLRPEQIPGDGARHFITANLVTALEEAFVSSAWIESGE